MATIEVDFEVYKELTVRRESESMTENDVIRLLLGLRIRHLNLRQVTRLQVETHGYVRVLPFLMGPNFAQLIRGRCIPGL